MALLNEPQLPQPVPLLQPLLAHDRLFHRAEQFVVDQHAHAMLLRESLDRLLPVLPDALNQRRRHADVERSIAAARENVDGRLLVGHPPTLGAVLNAEALDSRLRGNDVIRLDDRFEPSSPRRRGSRAFPAYTGTV
jgi:hypothetical protein